MFNKKILVSLMVIGIAGAIAGGSTMALFSDEESSTNNVFTAGSVDLTAEYDSHYNGELLEENQAITDDSDTPIFELTDLKPGDYGEATLSYQVDSNPAYVWMRIKKGDDNDGNPACTEPENDVDAENGACGPGEDGELDENLQFRIWYDYGVMRDVGGESVLVGAGDNQHQTGEPFILGGVETWADASDFTGPMQLDAYPANGSEEAFAPGQQYHVAAAWRLPTDTGNEAQTDTLGYNLDIYAEQRRHNDNPTNPWNTGT